MNKKDDLMRNQTGLADPITIVLIAGITWAVFAGLNYATNKLHQPEPRRASVTFVNPDGSETPGRTEIKLKDGTWIQAVYSSEERKYLNTRGEWCVREGRGFVCEKAEE